MQPFTATLQLAGRTITVRELSMPDFRNLLFGEEVTATEAAESAAQPKTEPVADEADAAVTALADNFINRWLESYLGERGVTLAFLSAMSSATLADLLQAHFSEIDALIAKIKALNAPFFELLQPRALALEPTSGALTETPEAPAAPPATTPPPEPPPTSASALNDPLLHSLEQAIQAHGATATSSSNPHSTNSSTA